MGGVVVIVPEDVEVDVQGIGIMGGFDDRASGPGAAGAPRVVAKGGGPVAERIVETARDHNVPLQQDSALAAALARIDLGREIPRELYVAVAHVLAFAWSVAGKNKG
jgi:flagellar biosynthesis protein